MQRSDRQYRLAYLYALVAVVFWATSASAFKISLRYVGVVPLLLFASMTSAAVFFIYLLASDKLQLLRSFTAKDYLWSAGLGFLNPFLYYVVIFKAYLLLPAQEAQPVNFVWPLTLVLLSIPLLGQHIRLASILAIVISFGGVVVIATRATNPGDILDFHFSNGPGVLLALGSTVIWALFWIYNTRDRHDEAVRLFVNFAFASAYILLTFLLLAAGAACNTDSGELVRGTDSVILRRRAGSRLVSPIKRPPTESVILSGAKDLAAEGTITVARGANCLSAGQMLHFVQHDKSRKDYFIRRRAEGSGSQTRGFSRSQARSFTSLRFVQDDKRGAGINHNPYNWRGLLGGVYIGLFEMGITFLAWLKALKYAKTTAHVVNLIYLVPFLSLVVVRLTLGEQILPSTIIGLVLIVTGIILQKVLA